MIKFLCTVCLELGLVSFSTNVFAKVEPQFQQLRDAKIQCDVNKAVQVNNGKVERTTMAGSSMQSFDQDGGAGFTDAKCFITPALDVNGKETNISFGCLPLDKKHVKRFNSEELIIKRREYNEVLSINFKTGLGSHSFDFSACDWGRKCVSEIGAVEFKNCTIN